MKTYSIATIPGDGIGKEVVPAGQQVLEALAKTSSTFRFEFENFDWGGDYYREHGVMMPADGLDAIRNKDAMIRFAFFFTLAVCLTTNSLLSAAEKPNIVVMPALIGA